MTPNAFELIFRIGGQHYLGETIRTLPNKTELFIHFPWGSRKEATIQCIDTHASEQGCLPDHISFHSDGTVHAKGRDDRKRHTHFNKLNNDINVFNPHRGHFLPIYLESIDVRQGTGKGGRLKPIQPSSQQRQQSWDLSGLEYFSIILVSKCGSINPKRLLANHGFQMLKPVGKPILVNIFTTTDKERLPGGSMSEFDTQLLILVVEQSYSGPAPAPPTSQSTLFLASVSMPPMDMIARMQNLN